MARICAGNRTIVAQKPASRPAPDVPDSGVTPAGARGAGKGERTVSKPAVEGGAPPVVIHHRRQAAGCRHPKAVACGHGVEPVDPPGGGKANRCAGAIFSAAVRDQARRLILAARRTRADRDGADWVINGQKIWTTMANDAKPTLPRWTDPDIHRPPACRAAPERRRR